MWYREEIDLFFTTGISFFSMLAYVGVSIENIFMEIIFWILPQYIVIVYPEYLYTTMLIFSVIIIARYRKIIKRDWKERLMYACKEFNIDLYNKKDSNNFRKQLYAKETAKNNYDIVCKDSQSTNDNVCTTSNPSKPLINVCKNTTIQRKSNNDTITSKNNTSDTENFDGNTGTKNVKNNVKKPENVQSDIVPPKCHMHDANLATGISGNLYPILVSYRAYLNLMVMICIFACDFPSFPQKHMKTDFFGLSLMDVGIGAYLFNNGCLHSYKTAKTLYTASLLFLLGCVRLLTLYLTNYKINITEYGKHLNFYFTLSFTYLLSLFRFTPKIGLLVMVIYEIALQNGLDIFIFTEKRNTLFLQNKEGIFQLIPSLCIFMFTRKISNLKKLPRQSARFLGLVRTTMVFILYYVISSYSYAPSRRLGNLSYVSWILALHSLHLTLTFVANYFVNYVPMKLHKYCSDNFMFSFLFANVIILICNLSGVQRFNRHLVMAGYLLSVFVIPYYVTKYLNKR